MQAENLKWPALIAQFLAYAVCALSVVSALSLGVWMLLYLQMAESPALLGISSLAVLLRNVLFLISALAVIIWVYMAHANMHRAKLEGLNFSPAWAAFSFLVPIANLWFPYAAMRELANRSAGEPPEFAGSEVSAVSSWWSSWVGTMVVGVIIAYTIAVALVPGLFMTTPFMATQAILVLGNVLLAAAAYFLARVISAVTADQRQGFNMASVFE